jgi:hypothetical protein
MWTLWLEHPAMEVVEVDSFGRMRWLPQRLEGITCPKPPGATQAAPAHAAKDLRREARQRCDLGRDDDDSLLLEASQEISPLVIRELGVDAVEKMRVRFERGVAQQVVH